MPSARPRGCAGPTLALPDCQAGQARQCGSAQGKGWSTPYHRPRWEPVLMTSRAPAAPQRRGGRREAAVGAGPPPQPSPGGHRGSDQTCPPTSTCPRSKASQRLVNELGTKGREEGKKEKKGPVSQLWPFMPRAFGPSSKGIGFAEANDDTSTSSGAGSACCWRRAIRVKKYCGHLIIDSLFLHYGRAQRPKLRLRPLCAHGAHAHTKPGSSYPESLARGGQHCKSWHHSPLSVPALPEPW